MRKLLFGFCAIFALMSCAEDNSGWQPTATPGATKLQKIVWTPQYGSPYFQQYEYSGNYLDKITTDDPGSYTVFTYTGNLITKMDYYTSNELGGTETFAYDAQQRMVSRLFRSFPVNGATRVDYVYDDAEGSAMASSYSGDLATQTVLNRKSKYYFQDGNIVKEEHLDPADDSVTLVLQCTYGNKHTPYSGILGYDHLTWIVEYVHLAMHDVVSMTYGSPPMTVDVPDSEILYNAYDFPTQSTTYNPDGSIQSQIQYYYQ